MHEAAWQQQRDESRASSKIGSIIHLKLESEWERTVRCCYFGE